MTNEQQIEMWTQCVEREFQFLVAKGYYGPLRNLEVAWGSISYNRTKLGIRLGVETVGFIMDVTLFLPTDKSSDSSRYLEHCLEHLHIQAPELTALCDLRGDFENHAEMIAIYAKVLQDNLETLEANAEAVCSFPLQLHRVKRRK